MVVLDKFNPFGDKFAENGFYDPNRSDLQTSAKFANVGAWTLPVAGVLKGGKLAGYSGRVSQLFANSKWFGRGSQLFGRQAGSLLNKNDVFRVGWSWKGTRQAGREIFRIATGGPLPKSSPQWLQKSWQWLRHFDVE